MRKTKEDILNQIRLLLELDEEVPLIDLYNQLHGYRNSVHPDRFLQDEEKRAAEEKFKSAATLLTELYKIIEKEKLEKKPNDIVPYSDNDFETINQKQSNINLEQKIESLKLHLRVAEIDNEDLKSEIKLLQDDKLNEKTKELTDHYRTSKEGLFRLGATFILTFILGVLAQVEKITNLISKYSPIAPEILKIMVFAILVIVTIIYLKSFYEQRKVNELSKIISTPKFINKFYIYLTADDRAETFTELSVYDFIETQLKPKNFILSYLSSNFFRFYSDASINSLKDIFIYNLIQKQFITISSARGLDRTFRIATR